MTLQGQSMSKVRETAEAMSLQERSDFYEGIVEELLPAMMGSDHITDSWGVGATRAQRIVLCALYDVSPKFLSQPQLLCLRSAPLNNDPDLKVVQVDVYNLRKKLSDSGCGARIVTEYGRGYSLDISQVVGP